MTATRVAIVGAAGETGSSIVNALLAAAVFSIVALTRPSSIDKPANKQLEKRGVEIVAADLNGPEDEFIKTLTGIEVVVSAIGPQEQLAQIPLATAAKKAGVKRFLPCGFITIAPPQGVLTIRDWKEEVYNHIKKIKLPYTIVDVGWWYQISVPRLPSGNIDYYAADPPFNLLVLDGNTLTALTDVRDIGTYIAAIITDPRTLNKYVFAYSEVWKPNDIYDRLEKLSGEKIPRVFVTEAELKEQIAKAEEAFVKDPTDFIARLLKVGGEYQISWGIRGDNTPEYAKYLDYLDIKELYPDLKFRSFESFLKEVLSGEAKAVYEHNAPLKAALASRKARG